MKIQRILVAGTVCFGLIFSGTLLAGGQNPEGDKLKSTEEQPQNPGAQKQNPGGKPQAGGERQGGGMRNMEVKTDCVECQPIVDQIKAKMEEMKAINDKANAFRKEEQKKFEELKDKDPKKYEEELAKREAARKEMDAARKSGEEKKEKPNVKEGENKDNKDGERQRGQRGQRGQQRPTPEQLEKMKAENPEMYKIMTEREAKQKEIMELRAKLKDCEAEGKGKK